jgi:hypothetical protein
MKEHAIFQPDYSSNCNCSELAMYSIQTCYLSSRSENHVQLKSILVL